MGKVQAGIDLLKKIGSSKTVKQGDTYVTKAGKEAADKKAKTLREIEKRRKTVQKNTPRSSTRDFKDSSSTTSAAEKYLKEKDKLKKAKAEIVGGSGGLTITVAVGSNDDKPKKPAKKANGGMLDSPAAVKRRSGAAVKGFKKGGMVTKWESKWG